ncbi:MAG: hypothetical protein Q8N69_00400 [bacterium]|nr:hypothetical protein [bacterium]
MNRLFLIVFAIITLFSPGISFAEGATIDFFFSPTCPHCAAEEKFLDEIQNEYPDLKINRYSVNETENLNKLRDFYQEYGVPQRYYGMVPATFTDNKYFIGFNEKIGEDIKKCLDEICYNGGISESNSTAIDMEGNITLPIVGKINIGDYSLPALAVILGTLDGFNVCSLGALVLILGLVLAFKSRKRILIFGGLFIFTTAVIYGLLIFLWYKIFTLFVPYMRLMQFAIGLLGIMGGVYFFKAFLRFKKYGPTCEITNGKGLIDKLSSRIQKTFKDSGSIMIILASVFLFAAAITIIEFPCSAVVPVAFAGVLAQAGLSSFQYLMYIALFVLFYMLDEIIVFLMAFFTMKVWLASSKIVTWFALVEAIVLFGLGFYYLFNLL